MNELEGKISAWRAQMSAALPGQEETLSELEAHLRDHLASLLRTGMAPGAAFDASVRRLGEVHGLAREFGRVRSARWPASWPVLTVLGLLGVLVAMVFVVIADKYSGGTVTLLLATHVFTVTAGYFSVLATGLLGAWALVTAWRRPLAERERRDLRQAIFWLTVASCVLVPVGVGLGMIWAAENLGRVWGWDRPEVGALLVLASAGWLFFAQLRAKLDDRVRWVLASFGTTAVAVGWFGVRALTATAPVVWLCAMLVASQVAVAMLRPAQGSVASAE